MGTRGYFVVKFEGRYYRIYNHGDSYPSSLGKKVVAAIKGKEIERSLKYLTHLLNFFLSSEDSVAYRRFILITDDFKDIENDVVIEWVYIIDLDKLTLTFTGGYLQPVYPLSEIPDDWLEQFSIVNEELAING